MKISGWLKQTVTVAPYTGRGNYGDPTFGGQRSQAARVEPEQGVVRKANGEEIPFNHVIYTETEIKALDRIWLPGMTTSDNTQAKVPAKVKTEIDKAGVTAFYKVLV